MFKKCMSTDVCTISPDTPLRRAAEKMAERDLGSIPVAKNDRLVGMVTDRDIAIRADRRRLRGGPEAKCRRSDDPRGGCTATPGMMSTRCSRTWRRCRFRRLPVIDDDKQLVGIVSIGDLVKVQPADAGQCYARVAEPSQLHSQSLT